VLIFYTNPHEADGVEECLWWLLVSPPSGLTDPGKPDGVVVVTEEVRSDHRPVMLRIAGVVYSPNVPT